MAMIAKTNVVSQSSGNIEQIFWKNIKDDENNVTSNRKFFSEKASLKDVSVANN